MNASGITDHASFEISGKDLDQLHRRARFVAQKLIGSGGGSFIYHLANICPRSIVRDDNGNSEITDWNADVEVTIRRPNAVEGG